MSTVKYRSDIDGLRALAVVPVVLFHAGYALFGGGFVGVDVFFVISGYLITQAIWKEVGENRFSIVKFYERRVRRIFPALFVMLFAVLVAAAIRTEPSTFANVAKSASSTTLFVSNFFFWLNSGYFDLQSERQPLLHTWSLAIEEQFYLIFPLLLWALGRSVRGVKAMILLLIAVSFVLSIALLDAHPSATFYLLPARAWELLVGAAIALRILPAPRSAPALEAVALAGLLCLLGPIFLYDRSTPFPGLAATLPCIGTALIIMAGENGDHRTWVARLLGMRPLVFVGLISYSLYLWHWPILVFLLHYPPYYPQLGASTDLAPWAVLLSAIAAVLSWRFVERPFRRPAGTALLPTRRPLFIAAGIAMAAVLALSALIVQRHGFPGRHGDVTASARTLQADRAAKRALPKARCAATDRQIAALCRAVGDTTSTRVALVWGDSFAGAWRTTFDEAGKRAGVRVEVIVHRGCPPLLDVQRPDHSGTAARCHDPDRAARIIAYARSLKPARIFLISRWSLYHNGLWEDGQPSWDTHFIAERGALRADLAGSRATLAREIPRTVAALAQAGPLTIFLETPTFMKTGAQMAYDDQPDDILSAKAFRQARQPVVDIVAASARSSGAAVFDPADIMCDRFCRWRGQGGLYILDASHMTAVGGKLYQPALATMLADPRRRAPLPLSETPR